MSSAAGANERSGGQLLEVSRRQLRRDERRHAWSGAVPTATRR